MVSINLKFRRSVNSVEKGELTYQLEHNCVSRIISSRYKIYCNEWDSKQGKIVLPQSASLRYRYLVEVKHVVEWEMKRLHVIASHQQLATGACDIAEIAQLYASNACGQCSVFGFLNALALHKLLMGKVRTSEIYCSTLNSFMRFRHGIDLTFDMLKPEIVEQYEAEMVGRGLVRNTTSFYMRILRTAYRRAVEDGLATVRSPFRHVYCGIEKTTKRSITLAEIKKIHRLDLSQNPKLGFARDMFIFSFCTRGMSFVDMAYLRKSDLKGGILTYRRRKTRQLLTIAWTRQMQEIIDKYEHNATQYLLPIITCEDGTERRQYLNQIMKINRKLKRVAEMAGVAVPMSMYYSRHSWATIARSKDIPLSVISKGLGHDSELTTQIYLDSIKSSEVDKANEKILRDLWSD